MVRRHLQFASLAQWIRAAVFYIDGWGFESLTTHHTQPCNAGLFSWSDMNELHLFAGAGGGILAGHLIGDRCIGAVEINPYAQKILLARQQDGSLPRFPIFGDILKFDARPFRGRADVVSGGFPCQDISSAGDRAGITGARSGLWREFARVVREVRPYQVRVENSADLTSRGLGVVLRDLAAMGFDARWGVLSAADL